MNDQNSNGATAARAFVSGEARCGTLATGFAELSSILSLPKGELDPIFRDLLERRMAAFDEQFRQLAAGKIVFANTETWRAAYERVLTSLGTATYKSVSWVKSEDYWRDGPGRQSMKLNFDLLDKGLQIERIIILGWNLWPPQLRLPDKIIRQWIEDQHFRGVAISVVRENDLVNDSDLACDFGIYGHRATGEQEMDDDSHTLRFVLSFDRAAVRLAQDRWERLLLFARPYDQILDHGLSVV